MYASKYLATFDITIARGAVVLVSIPTAIHGKTSLRMRDLRS